MDKKKIEKRGHWSETPHFVICTEYNDKFVTKSSLFFANIVYAAV